MMRLNRGLVFVVIGLAIINTACNKKETNAENKKETQVVAKVNGDEISVHQINFQLGRLTQNSQAQLTEAQGKQAAKQILARLIDQQLLKQQAIEAKLDRQPRVLQAIESSKNEILAQAYLEQMMLKADKPSNAEIDTFYKEHPELFEKRRIFRLQELAVDAGKDKYAEIEAALKNIKGINEIANWLKSNNYSFNANSNVRAAEQLPMEVLKKLQPLKDGEFIVVATDRSLNIVHLAATQSVPITREKATPIIEQYFLNQNKTNLAKKEIAALNTKAKIEFMGAFSDMKKDELASSKLKVDAKPVAVSADLAPKPITKATTDSNMEKGLAGL